MRGRQYYLWLRPAEPGAQFLSRPPGSLVGPGWDVRNFGVNGATLLKKGDLPYFKQKAHAEALAFKPDIVVIMLGTNDSKHRDDGSLDADHAVNNWQYRADYVPDYEALIARFRQANPAVKVYVCLPTPCFPGRWGINDKTIHDEIIPMVRQVAQETHATIIDLYAALSGKGDLFPDTVHPNKEGARLMAAAIYHALTGRTPPAAAAWMAPQREKLKAEIVESLYRGSGFGFDGSTL